MQYGIKSRVEHILFSYTLELKKGKLALMSSEMWKPCGNAVDEQDISVPYPLLEY